MAMQTLASNTIVADLMNRYERGAFERTDMRLGSNSKLG